jgi:hypothetical protein
MARRDPFVSGLMPVVDEQTKIAAMRAAATPKFQSPVEAALGRDIGSSTAAKAETAAERLERIRLERVETQAGENPDNPKPTEDPGPGMYWANFGGVWRKYKSPTSTETSTGKKEKSRKDNGDGTFTVTYDDGTTEIIGTKNNNNSNSGNPDKTLVSTDIDDATGDTIGYFSDGSKIVLNKGTGPVQSAEFKDAYALLSQTFRDYGLESLVPAIEGFMKRNLGPNQAAIELRTTPEYIKRFKGNDLRRASGKNALTEAEYLAVEDAYDQTLRAYGQQNYFGIDRKTKQEKAAELIGNDISAVEFKDRIQLAVDRVQNADPMTKNVLKQFYPTLNEADLIGYFLNPIDNLPKLQEKVTASEIGAAAKGLNLATDVAAATDLAKYGVTQAQAREGYSTIASILPGTQKLGDIYGESDIKYAQKEAEAEVFKGNQDAATKRKRLASMERAAFSGSSGTGQSSLTRNTQGLL